MIRKEISKLLRQIADRIDSGTCDMSPEETYRVYMLLSQTDSHDTTLTSKTRTDRLTEAYACLSSRISELESKVKQKAKIVNLHEV